MTQFQKITTLIALLIIILAMGWLSGYVTSNNLTSWYQNLNHPAISPPNWLFAPVWSIIYVLIAISAWLILIKGKLKSKILLIFIIQLILNFGWTLIFFGAHQIALALFEMSLLWLFILWTMKLFFHHDKLASYLLIPYFLWVGFAWILNLNYLLLN